MTSTDVHYESIAASYDELWTYSDEYIDEMTSNIIDVLEICSDHVLADVGGGTGLYARRIRDRVQPYAPILVVDPAPAMLKNLGDEPGICPIQATADAFAQECDSSIDRILLKEVVHHFGDLHAALDALRGNLAAHGRILVIMLPPTIDYPLFGAALRRYEELQPHYDEVVAAMERTGLSVSVEQRTINYEVSKARYLQMTRQRYMSVLSEFNDEELAAGVAEMARNITVDPIVVPDRFVYVSGLVAT